MYCISHGIVHAGQALQSSVLLSIPFMFPSVPSKIDECCFGQCPMSADGI